MKKILFPLAGILALSFSPAHAGSNSGTTTAPFLRIEQGARAIGMGGAFTAVADDSNAMWWNPAGIARAKHRELALSHTTFLEDVSTQFGAVVWPVKSMGGTLGASYTYYNIPGLTSSNAAGAAGGRLTANGYAASLAYGRFLNKNLSFGVNGKAIGQRLDTESGTSFAVDLGVQYKRKKLGLGFSFQNLGPDFKLNGKDQPLPYNMRGGASYDVHKRVLVAADIEKPRDGDIKVHLGSEFKASNVFTLRGGWVQLPELGAGSGISFGMSYTALFGVPAGWAGNETPWWERSKEQMERAKPKGAYYVFLDYAFVTFGDFPDSHRVTLGMRF